MTTHRPERVADVIREHLARLLREELRDPRVGFVTITDVRVSPDLRHARGYVSQLGAAADRIASVAALNRAVPFLRRELARSALMRRTPEIVFHEDPTLESGFRVDHLLDQIRGDHSGPDSNASVPNPEDDGS